MDTTDTVGRDQSLGKTAAMLAAAALVAMIVLAAIDHDGPVWILQGVLGLAAAVVGFRAGGTSPKNTLAFAGLLVGGILFLVFAAFLVSEA